MLKILIVDDDVISGNLLKDLVEYMGIQAEAVETAEEALEKLSLEKFDLLITDVNMPGMSGIELAKWVGEKWPGLKVVFISGFPQDNQWGAVSALFLAKPISFEELKSIIIKELST